MKKILIPILFLHTLGCFGQQWAEYKVDSNLTVSLPGNYDIIDTLGQRMIKAQISNTVFLIQKAANTKPAQIEGQLIATYNGFQDGVVRVHHGKLINKEIFKRDGLLVIRFSFTAPRGEERDTRYYFGIFLKDINYVISFWGPDVLTKELKADRDKLFSSIKFSKGLSLKDQLKDN